VRTELKKGQYYSIKTKRILKNAVYVFRWELGGELEKGMVIMKLGKAQYVGRQ
jgi:hypothetical protein